jgi:hypothetical protein
LINLQICRRLGHPLGAHVIRYSRARIASSKHGSATLVVPPRNSSGGGSHQFDGSLLRSSITYGVRDRRLQWRTEGWALRQSWANTTQSNGRNLVPLQLTFSRFNHMMTVQKYFDLYLEIIK